MLKFREMFIEILQRFYALEIHDLFPENQTIHMYSIVFPAFQLEEICSYSFEYLPLSLLSTYIYMYIYILFHSTLRPSRTQASLLFTLPSKSGVNEEMLEFLEQADTSTMPRNDASGATEPSFEEFL